jgi:hypothetical protein
MEITRKSCKECKKLHVAHPRRIYLSNRTIDKSGTNSYRATYRLLFFSKNSAERRVQRSKKSGELSSALPGEVTLWPRSAPAAMRWRHRGRGADDAILARLAARSTTKVINQA